MDTANQNEELYQIPARYRRLENLHIVFWLIKDLCWVMLWKPLGLIMIVPTIGAALLITWQTRYIKSELLHNIAVALWILANSYWMVTEFYWEENDSLRYYAVIPFALGIIVISYYYIGNFQEKYIRKVNRKSTIEKPKKKKNERPLERSQIF